MTALDKLHGRSLNSGLIASSYNDLRTGDEHRQVLKRPRSVVHYGDYNGVVMPEKGADQHSRTAQILRFADFEVDFRAGELRKSNTRVRLQEQPFQVLTLLLQSPGEVVTREELRERLWQSDTFVDFDNSLNTAINKIREALGDSAEEPRFVETVPRRGYRFIAPIQDASARTQLPPKMEGISAKPAGAIDSLAVLPLENASGNPETEYLSDGIAETLINSLAQLRKIRVVPRTLSFRYRGTGVDLLKAGRELGVRAVLAGRMMQRGEGLIVSIELVDVDRQAHLWGSRYNRRMMDLIALQEELATEIADKLRLQLTGEEKKRLRKHPSQNNEAFRLVLQAQHYISGGSPEGLSKGIALCQQAIDIDPAYAGAYARMAFARSIQYVWAYAASGDVAPRMVAAAKKALELDDTLADAHFGMGWSLFWTWDFAGAEREARRSIELNPDATEAWSLLDLVTLSLGRFEDAIAAGKRAVEVAPLDYFSSFCLHVTYLHTQQFENAIEQGRKTVDIDPGSPAGHSSLAQAYASGGQYKAAIEECDLALALNRKDTFLVIFAATGYAMAGETGKAHKLAEEVEKNWKSDGASAFWLAAVHAYLGEKDTAFIWLQRAYEVRAPFLVFLKIMWTHHLLQSDPRFNTLAKRIGIPD